jgi:hypothetical protein
MTTERFTWLVGAFVGALDAALVVALMIVTGALTGRAFVVIGELIGLAFVEGPRWLAPGITAGSILAAGVIGGRAARRGRDSLFRAAVIGVLSLVGGYVAWVFVWTTWRLGIGDGIGTAPFLPFEAALLAFAGLLLPAIVLFLPAGLLWAWVVGAILHGGSTPGRASS